VPNDARHRWQVGFDCGGVAAVTGDNEMTTVVVGG
jgi:hypothetical protein